MKKLLLSLSRQWPLLLFSSVSLLAYVAMACIDWRYGTLRAAQTPQTIAWYGLAFLAYIGLLFWAERRGMPRRWMWIGAILFRIILLFTTPTLSDDVYRYLWDGYVVNEGVSPYAYAINSPELDYLDIPQRALANNAWMASPYLPAAQAVFFGITAVFPLQPFYLQLAMIGFELAAASILARLLVMAALPPRRLLIYLWNPLVIVEVAHGAHIDAWMLLLTLLAVYFALKRPSERSKQGAEQSQSWLRILVDPIALISGPGDPDQNTADAFAAGSFLALELAAAGFVWLSADFAAAAVWLGSGLGFDR